MGHANSSTPGLAVCMLLYVVMLHASRTCRVWTGGEFESMLLSCLDDEMEVEEVIWSLEGRSNTGFSDGPAHMSVRQKVSTRTMVTPFRSNPVGGGPGDVRTSISLIVTIGSFEVPPN
jgi:hypothetical protein